jgi:hypothetical protein
MLPSFIVFLTPSQYVKEENIIKRETKTHEQNSFLLIFLQDEEIARRTNGTE